MLAILLVLTASALGLMAAAGLKLGVGAWTRVGLGIALGQALLLFVPFGLAAVFGLPARTAGVPTVRRHGVVEFFWRLPNPFDFVHRGRVERRHSCATSA
jgi:hypothetical protein